MKKLKLFFVGALITLGYLAYAGDIYFSDTGMARFHYIDVEGQQRELKGLSSHHFI